MSTFRWWLCIGIGLGFAGSLHAASYPTVAPSASHGCAVVPGGGVKCWGGNAYGQLGNGTTVNSALPVEVKGIKNVRGVATGGPGVSCALVVPRSEKNIKVQGNDVYCWGSRTYGMSSGDGTYNGFVTTPRAVPIWDVVYKKDKNGKIIKEKGKPIIAQKIGAEEVSIGSEHVMVRLANGAVKVWGADNWNNGYGALGHRAGYLKSYRATSVKEFGGARAVGAGSGTPGAFSCVAKANGTVWCAGSNPFTGKGSFVPQAVTTQGVQGIATGSNFVCALFADGALQCAGGNSVGQLGDGTQASRKVFARVSGLADKALVVRAGANHACALLRNGNVQCWGQNNYGQLGDGADVNVQGVVNRTTPVAVKELGVVKEIAVGGNTTCARKGDHTVWCFGDNTLGNLGNGQGLVWDAAKKQWQKFVSSVPVKVAL